MNDEGVQNRIEQLVAEEHEILAARPGLGHRTSTSVCRRSRSSSTAAGISCVSAERAGSSIRIRTMPRYATKGRSRAISNDGAR